MTVEQLVNGMGKLYEPEPNTGCWLWLKAVRTGGYGHAWCAPNNWGVHRLMYVLTHGPIKQNNNVMHMCDQPSCVNPAHLTQGTQAENMQDCMSKGRHPDSVGLSVDKVREIRNRLAQGVSQHQIAAHYGVDPSNISLIAGGKTWKNV